MYASIKIDVFIPVRIQRSIHCAIQVEKGFFWRSFNIFVCGHRVVNVIYISKGLKIFPHRLFPMQLTRFEFLSRRLQSIRAIFIILCINVYASMYRVFISVSMNNELSINYLMRFAWSTLHFFPFFVPSMLHLTDTTSCPVFIYMTKPI